MSVQTWQRNLAEGHTETWLATFITIWAIGVVLFSWWLATQKGGWIKYALAAILLYEVLP